MQLRDAARYVFERNPAVKDAWHVETIEEVYQEMKRVMLMVATKNAQSLINGTADDEWCNWTSTGGWIMNFFVADNEKDVEVEIHVDPCLGMDRTYMLTDEVLKIEEPKAEETDLTGKTVVSLENGEEYVVVEDHGDVLIACHVFDPFYMLEFERDEVEAAVDELPNQWIGKNVVYGGRSCNVVEAEYRDELDSMMPAGWVLTLVDNVVPGEGMLVHESLVKVVD
jgi:hypothetical protein